MVSAFGYDRLHSDLDEVLNVDASYYVHAIVQMLFSELMLVRDGEVKSNHELYYEFTITELTFKAYGALVLPISYDAQSKILSLIRQGGLS